MPNFAPLMEAIELSASGAVDPSGKTALDEAIERLGLHSRATHDDLATFLVDVLPTLTAKGPKHIKEMRYLLRRTGIQSRAIAASLEMLLNSPEVRGSVDSRLWVSLGLMDLGRPRSVAALEADTALRNEHVGEWLTLVAANENYEDARRAFIQAAKLHLISVPQLCLKAEVIRQQFGNKLAEFLKSMIDCFDDERDRAALILAFKRMYGMDLSNPPQTTLPIIPSESAAIAPMDWADPKTLALLNVLEIEADRRAA